MRKTDYIKKAWNITDDKVNEFIEEDCKKFNFILGVRVGLTIALRIINENWTETEMREYLENTLRI